MSKAFDIPLSEIERIIDGFTGEFTLDEVMKKLGPNRTETLRSRIYRLLDGDDRFFSDHARYVRRSTFFNGFRFLITPDQWELDNRLLFPGHRFAAFLDREVFPSEVKLIDAETQQEIGQHEITAPLAQIFSYHLLLGSEQIFDFLLAESKANARLRSSAGGNESVTLNVFDPGDFYARNNFCAGDALLCEVTDYRQGIVTMRYLSGADRSAARCGEFIRSFDTAIEKVCRRFEEYLDIPDQLAWGFFFAGDECREPLASADEFIRRSQRIAIRSEDHHAVLVVQSDDAPDDGAAPELPPGMVSISGGETGSPAQILKAIGSPFTPVEIDSFILDRCCGRDLNCDALYQELFGTGVEFADPAQEAIWLNIFEERFELLTDNYNRADDEPKAGLRGEILESVEAKAEFLRFLADIDVDVHSLAHDKFHRLVECSLQLDKDLQTLNDPGFTPGEAELDRLAEVIELRLDEHDKIIEELTGSIKKGE